MAAKIESWFDDLPEAHKKLIEPLRQMILNAHDEIQEELKWGATLLFGQQAILLPTGSPKTRDHRFSARCES